MAVRIVLAAGRSFVESATMPVCVEVNELAAQQPIGKHASYIDYVISIKIFLFIRLDNSAKHQAFRNPTRA